MANTKHWSDILVKHGACNEAIEWAKTQESRELAWENCTRSDWMFWILGRSARVTGKRIAKVACAIARTSLMYVPAEEKRPLLAIQAAERFLNGKETLENLNNAAESAAWSAWNAARSVESAARSAWSAARSAAESAARSAAESAWSAWNAAESAAWSARNAARSAAQSAESAAEGAAESAAWSAARSAESAAQKEQCDLIRAEFPSVPKLKRI